MFDQNFFLDRLHLTLGPVVMSHERRYSRTRPVFKNFPGCTDIRDSNDRIVIEPRETLSVNTNEHLTTKGKCGAIILPRLKTADSGLIYTPSYVDPWWDGILQAVIVNVTDSRQELVLGEKIATCFFFGLGQEIPEDAHEEFKKRSHHFAQSWSEILEHNANPFPRVKLPSEEQHGFIYRKLAELKDWTIAHIIAVVAMIGLGAILGAVYFIGGLSVRVEHLEKSETESMNKLKGGLPRSGILTVNMSDTQNETEQGFDIDWPREKAATVWLSALDQPEEVISLSGRLESSGSAGKGSRLVIRVSVKKAAKKHPVRVQWMLTGQ